jgi:Zn-dependent protease with chaperone function
MADTRIRLKGLQTEDFQHPLDREATSVLKKAKGLDLLSKKLLDWGFEREEHIKHYSSSFEVTSEQIPSLWKTYEDCCRILDVSTPPLFVENSPEYNAYTSGYTKPVVVITSMAYELSDEDTLRFLLGHELGHYKCGHCLYSHMSIILKDVARFAGELTLGIGQLLNVGLLLALLEWQRKAEFTADRTGLLTVQNIDEALKGLSYLTAPSSKLQKQVQVDQLLEQASRFDQISQKGLLNKFLRVNTLLTLTHPWAVIRMRELKNWAKSEQYSFILNGGHLSEAIVWQCPRCNKTFYDKTPRCPDCKGLTVKASIIDGRKPIAKQEDSDCPFCHARMKDGARFCSECGKEIK